MYIEKSYMFFSRARIFVKNLKCLFLSKSGFQRIIFHFFRNSTTCVLELIVANIRKFPLRVFWLQQKKNPVSQARFYFKKLIDIFLDVGFSFVIQRHGYQIWL